MIFLPLSALSMLRNSLPAFHMRKTRQLMKQFNTNVDRNKVKSKLLQLQKFKVGSHFERKSGSHRSILAWLQNTTFTPTTGAFSRISFDKVLWFFSHSIFTVHVMDK